MHCSLRMDGCSIYHPPAFTIDLLWDSVLVFRLQISMVCCARQRMNAAYIIEQTKPPPFCYHIHTKVNTHMQKTHTHAHTCEWMLHIIFKTKPQFCHTCKKRVIAVIYHRNFFWIFRKILGWEREINTAPKPLPEVAPSKMEVAPF